MSTNQTVTRASRNQAKKAIRAHKGWKAHRATLPLTAAGKPFDLRDADKLEILAICQALGIDAAQCATYPDTDDDDETETETETATEASDVAAQQTPAKAAAAPAAAAKGAGFEGRDAAEVINEALAPAHAYLTPHVLGMLPELLAPLAKAATQPARVVVKSAPSAGASVPPVVNVVAFESARTVFGFGKRFPGAVDWSYALDHNRLAVCDYAGPLSVKVDPDYVWDPEILAQLAALDSAGLCAWCYGPAGVGKTEGIAQYAARLNRPFVRIAINKGTESPEIIGQQVLSKDGGMVWKDGALAAAFRIPYCVILIDEPSLLDSGLAAMFQTALDQRRLFLDNGNETLEAAQGIFVCAADNTAGCGEDSGRYVGTEAMNAALLDRFALKIPFVHMHPDKEAAMLASRVGLAKDACALMVAYATTTRQNASSGNLSMGVTPRRLIAWAAAVRCGIPSATAFANAIISGCAPEDRETLLQLQETSLKSEHSKIDDLARGLAAPAPAQSPVEPAPVSKAGSTFPVGQ